MKSSGYQLILSIVALVVAILAFKHAAAPSKKASGALKASFQQARNFSSPSWGNGVALCLDPASTTSCTGGGSISDQNDCTCTCNAPGVGPCIDYYELKNRWQGRNPWLTLNQNIQWVSTRQNPCDDPVDFEPLLSPIQPDSTETGPTIQLSGLLSTSSSTTITALTTKQPYADQLLTITATGLATELLVQNTTRSNSLAWENRTGGIMTQPCAPVTVATGGTSSLACAENNAWANGDSINLLSMPRVCITSIKPTIASVNGTGTVVVSHLINSNTVDGGAVQPGDDATIIGDGVQLVEMVSERQVQWQANSTRYSSNGYGTLGANNSVFYGGATGGAQTANVATSGFSSYLSIGAGLVSALNSTGTGTITLQNVWFNSDTTVRTVNITVALQGYNYGSNFWIDQNTTLRVLPGATLDMSTNAGGITYGLAAGLGTLDCSLGLCVIALANTGSEGGAASTTLPVNLLRPTVGCCLDAGSYACMSVSLGTLDTAGCSAATPALGDRAINAPGSSGGMGAILSH